MKYEIVIFPAKPLQDFANSYRKRYDPHYTNIPPHITVKSGFETNTDQAKEIAQILHKVAQTQEPFDIKITKFSSFKPVNNVIYLKIDSKEYLEQLYNKINSSLPEQMNHSSYVPHITIAQELSNDEHSDVFSSLKMLKVNMQDKIDRFHLLYQLENGTWTVYETFRLRKDS